MRIMTILELVLKFTITLLSLSAIVLMGVVGGIVVILSSIVRGLK